MIPIEGDYGLWTSLVAGFVLGYGILELILFGAIAAGALGAAAKTTKEAVEGNLPWEDPLGHLKDTFVDTVPVMGPIAETATEGGDWGSAGLQSGIQLAGLGLSALGAPAGQVGANAAENIGAQAAKHAALGMPVADDLAAMGTIPVKEAGAAAGAATVAEGGGPISRASEAFANINTPADIGPALREVGSEAGAAIRAPFQALGRATHPTVGNVAYRAAVGAAKGAATSPRNPLRGAVGGVAGSLGTIAAGESAYAVRSGLSDLSAPKAMIGPPQQVADMATSVPAQIGGQIGSSMAFQAMTPKPEQPRMYTSPYPWQRYYGRRYV